MKFIVVLSLLFAFSTSASAYEKHRTALSIRHVHQETGVWCWAATLAMVGQYLGGRTTSDCEILTYYFQYILGQNYNCCYATDAYNPNRCNRAGHITEMETIMSVIIGRDGEWYNRRIKFESLVREIDEGYPVIAHVNGASMGHVIVISGYDTNTRALYINDPMEYQRTKILFSDFKKGYHGMKWDMTMQIR